MEQIKELSDERLKGSCPHCGNAAGGSRDHVPSKGLLRKPYPPNLPVIAVCPGCNSSFSADEEYFRLFLRCVLVGSTDPNRHFEPDVVRGLRRHTGLRKKIAAAKVEQPDLFGPSTYRWLPDVSRVNRVVLKNARGHVCYEYGEPVEGQPVFVAAEPLDELGEVTQYVFDDQPPALAGWPEVGSRMMTRILTGQDIRGAWIIVQDGVYRYSVDAWGGGTRVRSVLHEYLGTVVVWDVG